MPAFRFACHTIQFGEEQQTNRDKVLRDVAAAEAARFSREYLRKLGY